MSPEAANPVIQVVDGDEEDVWLLFGGGQLTSQRQKAQQAQFRQMMMHYGFFYRDSGSQTLILGSSRLFQA